MLCRREKICRMTTQSKRRATPPSPQRQATRMRPTYSIQQCLLCVKGNFFYPPPLSPTITENNKSFPPLYENFQAHFPPPLPISPKKPRLLVPHKFCKNGGKEEKWGPFPSASRQVGWGEQKKTRAAASCFFPSYTIFFFTSLSSFSRIEKKLPQPFRSIFTEK